MRPLYPSIEARLTEMLDVGEGHKLYVEESGVPEGIPVIFVHGGPGSGCSDGDRRFFDPERYRIVLFDQRGVGRSKPQAEVRNNDTGRMVADLERIREHLGIERWVVFGGSWGSTLGLLYAQAHPDRTLALVLRGIFLNRPEDFHWLYRDGTRRVFPEYWADLLAPLSQSERDDVVTAYHRRIHGDDAAVARAAATEWSQFEGRCATLRPNPELVSFFRQTEVAWYFARICTHYFVNHLFMSPNQILDHIDRLEGVPGVIVQGRYDMLCPSDQAWALHRAWPDSELHWIWDAGHSAGEPGTVHELVSATDRVADRLSGR